MDAEQFIKHLEDAMPSRDSLEEFGLDDDEIEEIQSTFVAHSRNATVQPPADEVSKLLSVFDCSDLEIGLIRFESQPQKSERGIAIAKCEADTIVLREDGAIVMHDHSSPGSTPIECAIDSTHFLDGLAAFVTAIKQKSVWKGRTEEAAMFCANAAGGLQNLDFFRLLCGSLQ